MLKFFFLFSYCISLMSCYTNIEGIFKIIDYCDFHCYDKMNVGCKRTTCQQFKFPYSRVDDSMDLIVQTHNSLRNRFALGEDIHVKGITASNMIAVQWHDELAHLARCALSKFDHKLKNLGAECTRTYTFREKAGHNLGQISGYFDDCVPQFEKIITDWYNNEIRNLSLDELKGLSETYDGSVGDGKLRNFTQLLWATTTHVGCATRRKNDDPIECTLYCYYGPRGNVKNMSMFKMGEPASECPAGFHSNEEFPGLCNDSIVFRINFIVFVVITSMILVLW